jgi:hypothetical protein
VALLVSSVLNKGGLSMFELFGSRAENPAALEVLMKTYAEQRTEEQFQVHIPLDVPIQATVIRSDNGQVVNLVSGSISVSLKRDTYGDPGDLGVSCSPRGDEVPARTINVVFRDYHDIYTDRGMVWVFPGEPGTAMFLLARNALDTPGLISEIAEAAVRAVNEKVLKHFTQPVH